MIEVLKAGFYDTIQDLGRFGMQNIGVPLSGAMDQYAAKTANSVLGNNVNDAVLEITVSGPKLLFHCDTVISLSGANLNALMNAEHVKLNSIIAVKKNDILSFGKLSFGCRAYLAVKGGLLTEYVMKSRSMCPNITSNLRLQKGDCIKIEAYRNAKMSSTASVKLNLHYFENNLFEVYEGPEFKMLSKQQQEALFSRKFSISKDSNRMGIRLKEPFPNQLKSIITSLVLPGTIQLTPSGELIILMRDCQVTGGYPRVLQVSENAINRLAQRISGSNIRFKRIFQ